MAAERPRIVIFDDFESKGGQYRYRDVATKAAVQSGWKPEVFGEVRPATEWLYRAYLGETEEIKAVVTSLGRKQTGGFEREYPASQLLWQAFAQHTPVALLSSLPSADRYVHPANGDIVVPKAPFDDIAPTLQAWFRKLVPEPSSQQ